jgi:hypothetical protein
MDGSHREELLLDAPERYLHQDPAPVSPSPGTILEASVGSNQLLEASLVGCEASLQTKPRCILEKDIVWQENRSFGVRMPPLSTTRSLSLSPVVSDHRDQLPQADRPPPSPPPELSSALALAPLAAPPHGLAVPHWGPGPRSCEPTSHRCQDDQSSRLSDHQDRIPSELPTSHGNPVSLLSTFLPDRRE